MRRIVIAGEALVDLVIAPDGSVQARLGGAPFNTARTCGRLGAPVSFAGAVSEDRFGRSILAALEADGVALDLVQRVPTPTTLAAAELDESGSATYRFYLRDTSAPALGGITVPEGAALVFTGGLGLVLEPMADQIEAMVAALPSEPILVVDINCRPRVIDDRDRYLARVDRMLARTDVVKVSDEDLAFLAPDVDPETAAAGLLDRGPSLVLLTAGAAGITVLSEHDRRSVPVAPVEVVDTIGAGDSFGGGLLAWWSLTGRRRSDLADLDIVAAAATAASQVAGITCTRTGADPPSRRELPADWAG